MDLLSLPKCAAAAAATTMVVPSTAPLNPSLDSAAASSSSLAHYPSPPTTQSSLVGVLQQQLEKPISVLSCLSAAIPSVTDPALKISTTFLSAVRFLHCISSPLNTLHIIQN